MSASIGLLGFDRLQRAFHLAPNFTARELESWVTVITLYLQSEVQERTPKRDGTLQQSTISEVKTVGRFGVEGIVGTPLDYAPPVEFGAKPHDIVPKNGKALHFMMRGIPVFAKKVHHPGSKGAFMFTRAFEENLQQIQADFYRFVDHVLAKIATGSV